MICLRTHSLYRLELYHVVQSYILVSYGKQKSCPQQFASSISTARANSNSKQLLSYKDSPNTSDTLTSVLTKSPTTLPLISDQSHELSTDAIVIIRPPVFNAAHEFDSYELVSGLIKEGQLTDGQSAALCACMHALWIRSGSRALKRFLLKAELENETYLFRAAMSELKNEVNSSRKKEAGALHLKLGTLQREMDLLCQLLGDETIKLKNNAEIEVSNRKTKIRKEQKTVEIKIQELNNKILVLVLSDLRGDIEKLKWQITRRGLMAISIAASLVFLGIYSSSYNSVFSKRKQKELNRKAEIQLGFESESASKSKIIDTSSFVSLG